MSYQKDLDRGSGEVLRLELSEFKGRKLFNIRIWYQDKESGEYRPTAKGVTIRPDQFEEFKKAILEAEPLVQAALQE
ncbi:MAG: transcriptional coactivator p15/PC4 family protein [Leptospiraceae bacterium]|nr:transcriptional coactivator p15/PC4 family protein [Leptospiraceae bacterium]MCB1305108.1 transcriptional coactivator p15/PC4 family protein [Leptospiraceae bacterium]